MRAMDTVTDVVNILAGKNVSKFLVAGASKVDVCFKIKIREACYN